MTQVSRDDVTPGGWTLVSTAAPISPRNVRSVPQTYLKQIQKVHMIPPQFLDVQNHPRCSIIAVAEFRTMIPWKNSLQFYHDIISWGASIVVRNHRHNWGTRILMLLQRLQTLTP